MMPVGRRVVAAKGAYNAPGGAWPQAPPGILATGG